MIMMFTLGYRGGVMVIEILNKENEIIETVEVQTVKEYEEFVEKIFPVLLEEGLKVNVKGSIG